MIHFMPKKGFHVMHKEKCPMFHYTFFSTPAITRSPIEAMCAYHVLVEKGKGQR